MMRQSSNQKSYLALNLAFFKHELVRIRESKLENDLTLFIGTHNISHENTNNKLQHQLATL